MKKLLLLFVFFYSISTFAQQKKQQLQLELSMNLPLIANQSNYINSDNILNGNPTYPIKSITNITERLGVSFRATYSMPVMGEISASAGLSVDYLAFNIRSTKYSMYPSSIVQANNGKVFMLDQPLNQTRVLYFGIPLIGNYSLVNDKITVHLGLLTNFLLYNKQMVTSSSIKNDIISTNTNNTSRGLYKTVSLLEIGANYTIIENLGVNFKFQRALTPIFERNYIGSELMHYNVFSFGVSYNLF